MSRPEERELEQILADARALLDEELARARPAPDASDVRQRSRALAGELPELSEPGPEQLAGGEPLWTEGPSPAQLDELGAINRDARLLLDAALDARVAPRGAPRLAPRRAPRGAPRGAKQRWRRSPRFAAVAVAAVLVLGLTGVALAHSWRESRRSGEAERFAAEAALAAEQAFAAELELAPPRAFPSYRVPALPPSQPPAPAEQDGQDEQDEPAASRPAADRLASLDAEAYASLRAGEREQARREFQTIVEIGGRSQYAELAFGELFALARHDEAQLEKLWRHYLRRFPRGRYADAAQAGLCRRAPDRDRRRCWTQYLQDHPRGAARSEALRETEAG